VSTLRRIAAEWNRNAPARCRQLDEGKDVSHDKILIPSIIALSKGLGGKDVLDVGCGCGVLSSLASAKARRVLAIDISRGMISEARKRFGSRPNLEFSVISVEALAKSFENQFDVCLSNMSVVTMPNLQEALLSVSKLLKPRGGFVFSITRELKSQKSRPVCRLTIAGTSHSPGLCSFLYTRIPRPRATRGTSADLFLKVCGSSHRSQPRDADLQNRPALGWHIHAETSTYVEYEWG
jgi:SAM-dependent methyltransferase